MTLAFIMLAIPLTGLQVLTPGAVRPLTQAQVCSIRWGTDARHVSETMKKQVAVAYGIPWSIHTLYEFDHKVPRSLAGADVVENLMPQCCRRGNRTVGPAHLKDLAETAAHKATCDGRISLKDAQDGMAQDWTVVYRRFVGEFPKVVD